MIHHTLSGTSIIWLFVVSFAAAIVFIEIGCWIGKRRAERPEHKHNEPVGTLVGSLIGLLAFLMAFTFGMAGTYYEARRELVVKEANAIGTAYLRADFLPEPNSSQVRDILRKYVDIRLEWVKTGWNSAIVDSSETMQKALWDHVAQLSNESTGKVFWGLFVQSLNEVIDLHTERMNAGLQMTIPGVIWVALYLLMFISMLGLGYQFGLGTSHSRLGIVAMALALAIVMTLIFDLSSPGGGFIKTPQWALLDLQKKLHSDVNARR